MRALKTLVETHLWLIWIAAMGFMVGIVLVLGTTLGWS